MSVVFCLKIEPWFGYLKSQKNMEYWIRALEEFNATRDKPFIPKRGSAAHTLVIQIMKRLIKEDESKVNLKEKPKCLILDL